MHLLDHGVECCEIACDIRLTFFPILDFALLLGDFGFQ